MLGTPVPGQAEGHAAGYAEPACSVFRQLLFWASPSGGLPSVALAAASAWEAYYLRGTALRTALPARTTLSGAHLGPW